MKRGATGDRTLFCKRDAPGKSLPELVARSSAKKYPGAGAVLSEVRWGVACLANPRKRVAAGGGPLEKDTKKALFAVQRWPAGSGLAEFARIRLLVWVPCVSPLV
jgi:hypothetical protein